VYIVSGSGDKTINVWDASDGTCVKTLPGHTNYVYSVSTFTDANTDKVYIVSGSRDKTIKVWNASNELM
jgi:WD40 repeat protein